MSAASGPEEAVSYKAQAWASSKVDWFQVDWIGLREILQETIDFPIKYGAFL